MQRRAAAVLVAFFVVISVASYALIATAAQPEVTLENPDHSLKQGDSFTVGGQEYTVSKIEATKESSGGGGGHSGGGGGETLVRSGELTWTNESAQNGTNESAQNGTNESAQNTVQLEHRSNVTLQGTTYLAFFPNNETVYLTQDFESYQEDVNRIEQFHEHVSGLWGVSILSGLAAVLLLGLAYLPSRY